MLPSIRSRKQHTRIIQVCGEVLSDPLKYNLNVNSGMLKKLSHFHALISDFIEQNEKLNAFELAQQVIKKTGIAAKLIGI